MKKVFKRIKPSIDEFVFDLLLSEIVSYLYLEFRVNDVIGHDLSKTVCLVLQRETGVYAAFFSFLWPKLRELLAVLEPKLPKIIGHGIKAEFLEFLLREISGKTISREFVS
ncbi:MAG: hypothetical protein PXY39_12895, partial [archaeon]|nr:hypothetical protein [archaeon]